MRQTGSVFISNDLRAYNAEMDLYKCLCDKYERRPTLDIAEYIVEYVVYQMPEYAESDPQSPNAKHAFTQQICLKKDQLFQRQKPFK